MVRLAFDDPLRRKVKSRVRPALDPEEPKVLTAAEMALWRVRRLEDGAMASAALDSDRLMRAWLSGLFDRAQARVADTQGDAHEGAVALAARLGLAIACLDPAKLSVKGDAAAEAKEQLEAMRQQPAALVPLGIFSWTPELQCAWRRNWVLGQPFLASRGGYAAPLTLLTFLTDPKLKSTWVKLRARRDQLFGGPAVEPLQQFLERSGNDPGRSLDDLVSAIDGWGQKTPPPPVFALAPAPFEAFLNGLQGAERLEAIDELSAAVQDGRIKLPTEPSAAVEPLRESALGALCAGDAPKGLQIDAVWRDRLTGAFCALQGAHHESRESNFELPSHDAVRTDLNVVLEVPPQIEAEPAPVAYRRAADAATRLAAVLSAEGLHAVLDPEGGQGDGAVPELKRWATVLRGLAVLSSPGEAETADVAAARAFIAGWRADPFLSRDVRFAAASPVDFEHERTHAVIQGVARRELAVTWSDAPTAAFVGDDKAKIFTLDLKAEQRFLVPVLLTTTYRAEAAQLPLSFKDLRKAIDAAGRQPTQIPAAISELAAPKPKPAPTATP